MLKIRGWLRAAALTLALCLLLTGCSFPMQETIQVEELLRAPRLAGDYGALQAALNDWLGESAQLKYPMQGDLLSPFVLQDFDGDGQQDAAVFYTTALTSNVCVAFLRKNSEGSWQALITALSHLLRYSLMSNDEQVPLAREVRIVDEYYSIYHVRFGDRVKMVWRISDSLDLTETMVPSFILQPIVENAFKHGISPKEEGGVVRIRINPLREKGLLYISVCDNGVGIQPQQLAQLKAALARPGERWEHIGVYNVAARLRLLDKRGRLVIRSHPGRGTAISMYLPLVELLEEELDDDPAVDRG